MSIYLDSSFLISLYSADGNTSIAIDTVRVVRQPLLITVLTELEFVNGLGLQVFRKQIFPAEAQLSNDTFERNLQNGAFQLKPLPENVFERSRSLSRKTTPQRGTRAADLLHVAAALELGATAFYSFDLRQRKLARSVKLKLNALP